MEDGAGSTLDTASATRVMLRPIASPFALGFLGLAGASVTLSGLELGWVPPSEGREVGLIVVVFATLLQAIACVFGFLGRDAVAATGMGTLAGTWACVGGVQLLAPGGTSRALGMLLFVAGAAALLSALTAAQAKVVPAAVMLATATRFCLSGAYQSTRSGGWGEAAGWAGLVVAALALYAASSLETEDLKRATVIPTLRHGRGREVMQDDLARQVEKLGSEAGVRERL